MADNTISIDQKIKSGLYPDYKTMYDLYITQNKSRADICNLYHFSTTTFAAIVKILGIHKDQSQKVELRNQTNLKKYHTPCTLNNKKVQEKMRKTMMERYGVEHASQCPQFVEKRKKTCLERYGTTCNLQTKECREKSIATCRTHYGVDNAGKSPVVRQRIKQTMLERYGVEHPSQSPEIYQKILKTTKDRYGVEHPMQSEDIRIKQQNTCLIKYGVNNPMKNSDIQQKAIKTNFSKYQRSYPWQQQIEHYDIWSDDSKFILLLKQYETKPTIEELSKFFNLTDTPIAMRIHECNCDDLIHWFPGCNKSQPEEEIIKYLKEELKVDNILTNRRDIIDNGELDIYCPDQKIAIEFNGTYWHSLLKINDKKYHFNKSLKAEQKGIRLIHIYEYEWNDSVKQSIIKSLLSISFGHIKNKIYARNCDIKIIDNKIAKPFNDQNHLQGHRNAQVTYGLFYKDKLVQLMSFSKTRYNRNLKNNNSWEIIRGCPGSNNIVIGGVSKLFKHFVKDYNPQFVFSYCDFNKFDGKGYEAIGMSLDGYTGPDMKWVMPDYTVLDRNPSKHQEFKQQAKTQIYGAGSKKYIWNKNKLINIRRD